jgi:hypothetical protein
MRPGWISQLSNEATWKVSRPGRFRRSAARLANPWPSRRLQPQRPQTARLHSTLEKSALPRFEQRCRRDARFLVNYGRIGRNRRIARTSAAQTQPGSYRSRVTHNACAPMSSPARLGGLGLSGRWVFCCRPHIADLLALVFFKFLGSFQMVRARVPSASRAARDLGLSTRPPGSLCGIGRAKLGNDGQSGGKQKTPVVPRPSDARPFSATSRVRSVGQDAGWFIACHWKST